MGLLSHQGKRTYWVVPRKEVDALKTFQILEMLRHDSVTVENRDIAGYYVFSAALPPSQDRLRTFGCHVVALADSFDQIKKLLKGQYNGETQIPQPGLTHSTDP